MFFRSNIIWLAVLLAAMSGAQAEEDLGLCGNPFVNARGIGPFDYMSASDRNNPRYIPTLEKHHFNIDVQTGRRGQSSHILKDLDFILRACPNHHRALYTLINYHLKHDPMVPFTESASCYIDRASRFRPDDGTVHMLSGIYHARINKLNDAQVAYERALELMPESSELHYNIGLLYMKKKKYTLANEHAVQAYRLGAQLPGLKRQLIRAGAWDPDAVPVPAPAAEQHPVDDTDAVEAQVSEADVVE